MNKSLPFGPIPGQAPHLILGRRSSGLPVRYDTSAFSRLTQMPKPLTRPIIPSERTVRHAWQVADGLPLDETTKSQLTSQVEEWLKLPDALNFRKSLILGLRSFAPMDLTMRQELWHRCHALWRNTEDSRSYRTKPGEHVIQKSAHALQGKIDFQGLEISVENRKGSVRKWYDKEEEREGQTLMKYPYGYIQRTMGADGDKVDVYVGPNKDAQIAFVVHQLKAPDFAEYDEDKVMLGFDSSKQAKVAYLDHYDDKRFFGGINPVPMKDFKERILLKKSDPWGWGYPDAQMPEPSEQQRRAMRLTVPRGPRPVDSTWQTQESDGLPREEIKIYPPGWPTPELNKGRLRLLSKAHPVEMGWEPIPSGSRGGFRRKLGSGWEYWYPKGGQKKPPDDQSKPEKTPAQAKEPEKKVSAGKEQTKPREAAEAKKPKLEELKAGDPVRVAGTPAVFRGWKDDKQQIARVKFEGRPGTYTAPAGKVVPDPSRKETKKSRFVLG